MLHNQTILIEITTYLDKAEKFHCHTILSISRKTIGSVINSCFLLFLFFTIVSPEHFSEYTVQEFQASFCTTCKITCICYIQVLDFYQRIQLSLSFTPSSWNRHANYAPDQRKVNETWVTDTWAYLWLVKMFLYVYRCNNKKSFKFWTF